MPETYKPSTYYFQYRESHPPEFLEQEHMDCPHCGFRIPVRPEYIDYKALYRSLEQFCKKQNDVFNNFLADLQTYIPEVTIYMHNQEAELMDKLRALIDKLKESGSDEI